MGRLIWAGTQGESELHPVHVTAWGTGDRPVMLDKAHIYQNPSSNVVFTEIEFGNGIKVHGAENVLLDDVHITGSSLNARNGGGLTLRDSEIVDAHKDAPKGEDWSPFSDRSQGMFVKGVDGLLVESTLIDRNGWAPDYREDGDASGGQPPSMFSQNVYIQRDVRDVTFRDSVSMAGSSFGAQFRPGAFVEDNAFIDNNAGFNAAGGTDLGGGVRDGNYSLIHGNLVTSAGHKDAPKIGGKSMGIRENAEMSTLKDNVVAHLANPDDPAEIAAKTR
jgi:hypothetical protein